MEKPPEREGTGMLTSDATEVLRVSVTGSLSFLGRSAPGNPSSTSTVNGFMGVDMTSAESDPAASFFRSVCIMPRLCKYGKTPLGLGNNIGLRFLCRRRQRTTPNKRSSKNPITPITAPIIVDVFCVPRGLEFLDVDAGVVAVLENC